MPRLSVYCPPLYSTPIFSYFIQFTEWIPILNFNRINICNFLSAQLNWRENMILFTFLQAAIFPFFRYSVEFIYGYGEWWVREENIFLSLTFKIFARWWLISQSLYRKNRTDFRYPILKKIFQRFFNSFSNTYKKDEIFES